MKPSEVLRRAESYLDRHGVRDARTDAEILLMDVLGTDRAALYAGSEPLDAAQSRAYGLALCRRCEGTPVQHLTGDQPFRGLSLEVRDGVFIPRPETEVLVDRALACVAGMDAPLIVDVGTGTGAVALSIKSERPDASVMATDVSSEAVELARANARRLGLDVEIFRGDMLEPLPPEATGGISMVVSNPPYVTPEEYANLPAEVLADPASSLLGGIHVYQELLEQAVGRLAPGGWIVVEIGSTQGADVSALFAGSLIAVEVTEDLAGLPRVVAGRRA